jgi:hypothetical protein
MILEYYAISPKDLIRFGCVCQHWRGPMLISPLWCGFGRKFVSPPRTISTKFQNRIRIWNQERARLSAHSLLISIADCALVISGLSFGVNWSSLISQTHWLGFLSADLALICPIVAFSQKKESGESDSTHPLQQFACVVFSFLLLVMILAQIKVMSHPPLVPLTWLDVLTPLYVIFILFTVMWLKALVKDPRGMMVIPYIIVSLIVLPPLAALSLYGHHLDHPHEDPPSRLLTSALVYPHLLGLSFYFCSIGSLTLYRLLWSRKRIPIRHQPLLVAVLASVTIGLLSTALFCVQSGSPLRRIAWLERSVNCIFYLFLMQESVAMTAMNGDKLNQRIGLWSDPMTPH